MKRRKQRRTSKEKEKAKEEVSAWAMFVYLEEKNRGVSLSLGPCIDEGLFFFFALWHRIVQDFFSLSQVVWGQWFLWHSEAKETLNKTKDKAFA